MERIQTSELSSKAIGKYIGVHLPKAPDKEVVAVKVLEVSDFSHSIVAERIDGPNAGMVICTHFLIGREVCVYEEDEVVLLAFVDVESKS
jgi:hypothetical protein